MSNLQVAFLGTTIQKKYKQVGISKFQQWLETLETNKENIIIGVEGGSTSRNALLKSILTTRDLLFEVNPLYTKHKRSFGTKGDKTDIDDAKLVAGVLTTELEVKKLYQKKIASGKTKKEAILFIMRKTAILLYSMLKSGEEYRG